ncbi:MAG: hypothetical protein ACP5JG_15140, partial [Anaerolineae bacterium]
MKGRKWFAFVVALVLVFSFAAGCQPATEEPTEAAPTEEVEPEAPQATAEPEEPAEEPTEETVVYDTEIYGDLENLDPSGQEVTYWYQHTGSREELMLSLIDEFN